MKTERELWFEITKETGVEVVDKVCQLDYSVLLVHAHDKGLLEKIRLPQRMRLAFLVSSLSDIEKIEKDEGLAKKTEYVIADNVKLVEEMGGKTGIKTGLIINVKDKASLDKAVQLVRNMGLVIVEFKDPTNIPLELILATTQKSECRIFKKVKNAKDGEVSTMTMEMGCDGLLLASNDIQEITAMANVIRKAGLAKFNLKEAVVTCVKSTGMGTRVCVDTTSELSTDEGMILGSTSGGGVMTCSETHFLPYMNLRTFRVNAGGIHLYAWGPDDQAVYLSDLKAGDKIYVVNSSGSARVVTVGRLKIETRPLLMIECEIEGTKVSTFIQDDWHVRMFGSKGEIRPSSEIKVGDKLLGYLDQPGRHVGIKIDETIKEV